jgi:hypothetical protein
MFAVQGDIALLTGLASALPGSPVKRPLQHKGRSFARNGDATPTENPDAGLSTLKPRAGTVLQMSGRMSTRRRRRLQALVLATVAIGLVVVEPFPKGKVLLSLTNTHGIDVGDLPSLAMLLLAAYLCLRTDR